MTNPNRANKEIRERMEHAGIYQWQVAQVLGISHVTVSVWLRTELDRMDPRRVAVLSAITTLEGGKHGTKENKQPVSKN